MMRRRWLFVVPLAATLVLAELPAWAAPLEDKGMSLYDPALGISFLEDANYARTSGFHSTGFMLYNDALDLIDSLNSTQYLGVDSWSLPTLSEMQHIRDVDGITMSSPGDFDNLGSYYWVQGVGTADMASGFHDATGYSGAAYRYVLPVFPGEEPTYTKFYSIWRYRDIVTGLYVFTDQYVAGATPFSFASGLSTTNDVLYQLNHSAFASPPNPVPEPTTLLLLGSAGVAGVLGSKKRRGRPA